MDYKDLLTQYNYDSFNPRNFEPWMKFDETPAVGQPTSDFPLWGLDKNKTSLKEIASQNLYTIVEFGSFT